MTIHDESLDQHGSADWDVSDHVRCGKQLQLVNDGLMMVVKQETHPWLS